MFTIEEKEKERLETIQAYVGGKALGEATFLWIHGEEGCDRIWERKGSIGGPWVISDSYLSVARWKPEFNPKRERIESVVAWVRFSDLPAPLFDKKFLLNLGNSIGKAIRLDIHTAQRARGKFARMCVELDLTKPLVPEFKVDGQTLSVVYESLNLMCSKCGWYGHNRVGCEAFHRRQAEEGMEVELQGAKQRVRVLNTDAGNDEGVSTEEGVRKEITTGVSSVKGQRMESNPVQKKHGKNSSMGDGIKGAEKISKGGVPESNLNLGRRKVVAIEDKENMHPGEGMEDVEMDTDGSKCVEKGAEPFGGLGLSMGEMIVWNCRGAASKGIAAREEAEGFSGGIWMLWNLDELCVDVLVKNDQFIHCKLQLEGKELLFTAIYASPSEQRRHITWDLLRTLAEGFDNAEFKVLPRVGSDHHPILINLDVEKKRFGVRNFRYEAVWQMHESFGEVIQSSWAGDEGVHVKLPKLQQDLARWNKETFGNIAYRKTKLLNKFEWHPKLSIKAL
ncbi:hypothetical protein K1719_021936 [Acacia pycnantha]|nr:hypothetical protein K1719_021936 [Acacia pycnantha]